MNKVITAVVVSCVLTVSFVLSGCGGSSSGSSQIVAGSRLIEKGTVQAVHNVPVSAPGTVLYVIKGDSGRYYQGDFAPALQQDGLRVSFTAQVLDPQIPADGLGIPVTFTQISKL